MMDLVIILAQEIDCCNAYRTIRRIRDKHGKGEVDKKDLIEFYFAKELIRERDYKKTDNKRYRNQYFECLSIGLH